MEELAITACGLVTSVGFDAPSSLAAIRAGIRNVKETNLWDPESGTYLAAAKVPLPQWWVGIGKLADLAAPPILECLMAAQPIDPIGIPILLGVAGLDRPFRFPELDVHILLEVEHRLGFRLHPSSRVIPQDHVSVATGLLEAGRIIARREAESVVVAAVDSLLVHELKNYYLSKRRLLTPNNSNGFSLGEAGSALLVTMASGSEAAELRILGIGLSVEQAAIETEQPLRAQGLTMAIRSALTECGLTMSDISYRIADVNGEHYKFKELALATGRFARDPTPQIFDVWHPIEFIGDVGAAIGPTILGVALHAGQQGYGLGSNVLCTLGNDDGARAAIVVSYQGNDAS